MKFDIYIPTKIYNNYLQGSFEKNVENHGRPYVGPFKDDYYIPFNTQNQNKKGCKIINVEVNNKNAKNGVAEKQTLLLKNAIRIPKSEIENYDKKPIHEELLKKINKNQVQEELVKTIDDTKVP